jgi:hypothetical protein
MKMKKLYAEIDELSERIGASLVKQKLILLTLTPSSRNTVLQRFPPKFPRVVAKHCTYFYGGESEYTSIKELPSTPKINKLRVVGYAEDEYLETLVCEVEGQVRSPDKRIYHITLSLDPKHRETHHSNDLLRKGWTKIDPFTVSVQVDEKHMMVSDYGGRFLR